LIVIVVVILTFVLSRSVRPLAKQKAAVLKRSDAQPRQRRFPTVRRWTPGASNAGASFFHLIQVSCQLTVWPKPNMKQCLNEIAHL
jgi:hypothetical protein